MSYLWVWGMYLVYIQLPSAEGSISLTIKLNNKCEFNLYLCIIICHLIGLEINLYKNNNESNEKHQINLITCTYPTPKHLHSPPVQHQRHTELPRTISCYPLMELSNKKKGKENN